MKFRGINRGIQPKASSCFSLCFNVREKVVRRGCLFFLPYVFRVSNPIYFKAFPFLSQIFKFSPLKLVSFEEKTSKDDDGDDDDDDDEFKEEISTKG